MISSPSAGARLLVDGMALASAEAPQDILCSGASYPQSSVERLQDAWIRK